MKKIMVLLSCVYLVGFSDFEVNKVKNTPIRGIPDYTYGKVLDNHKVCENVQWRTDEQVGVKKVAYLCRLKKGNHFFNFNEEEAQSLQQENIDSYTENEYTRLNIELFEAEYRLGPLTDTLNNLISLLKVDDYLPFTAGLDSNDPSYPLMNYYVSQTYGCGHWDKTEEGEILQNRYLDHINLANQNQLIPALVENVKVLNKGYLDKLANGLTKEEIEFYQSNNNCVKLALERKIKETLDLVTVENQHIDEIQKELESDKIDQKAKEIGEVTLDEYHLTHKAYGEENIVWGWNTNDERYDVLYQFMREYGYNGEYADFQLTWEQMISSVEKNMTDVDSYMEENQKESYSLK